MNSWQGKNLRGDLGLLRESLARAKGNKKQRLQKQIAEIIGTLRIIGQKEERGKKTEQRLLHIVMKYQSDWPWWMRQVDAASAELDLYHGTDVVVTTDRGLVPLQVKSSWDFVHLHTKKYPNVPFIVVLPSDREIYLLRLFVRIIGRSREEGIFI